jgi:hypothetical protein
VLFPNLGAYGWHLGPWKIKQTGRSRQKQGMVSLCITFVLLLIMNF